MFSVIRSLLLGSLLWLALCAPSATACNVPVFRYALERWRADPYEMVLFHRGPLDKEQQKAVEILKAYDQGREGLPQCVTLDLVDVDSKDLAPEVVEIWKAQKASQTPWLVIYAPVTNRKAPLWAGPLRHEMVRQILFSPTRRIIAERILKGQTAVAVVLESGDKAKDDKAAKLLEQELKKMPTMLKLPELTDDPADALRENAPPLKIEFSTLRLSRENQEEKGFVKMLLHSEADLVNIKEPMIFFIFGRGRSLNAYLGAGITAANIKEACQFLVGACSCEVKRQNPGFDVLVDVDWEDGLVGRWVNPPEPPPLASLAPQQPYQVEKLQPIEDLTRPVSVPSASPTVWESPVLRTVLIAAGSVIALLLIAGTVFLMRRG